MKKPTKSAIEAMTLTEYALDVGAYRSTTFDKLRPRLQVASTTGWCSKAARTKRARVMLERLAREGWELKRIRA